MTRKVKIYEHSGEKYGATVDGGLYKIIRENRDSEYSRAVSEVQPGEFVLVDVVGTSWGKASDVNFDRKTIAYNSRSHINKKGLVKWYMAELRVRDFDDACIDCFFGNRSIPELPDEGSSFMKRMYMDRGWIKGLKAPQDNSCRRGMRIYDSLDDGWKERLLSRMGEGGLLLDNYRGARIVKEKGEFVIEQDGQLFSIKGTNDYDFKWDGKKIKMPMRVAGSKLIWFKKGQSIIVETPSDIRSATRRIVANFNNGRAGRFWQLAFGNSNLDRIMTRYHCVLYAQLEDSWRRHSL